MGERITNWAGNQVFGAAAVARPTTIDELRRVVAGASAVRALGAGHSFSLIADTPGTLVATERLDRIGAIDRERRTVTVEGGVRYAALGPVLEEAGFALPNLASLPHISVAGACATATHGSGDGNAALAAAVSALEFVTADGDLVRLSRAADGDRFLGAVVGLGGLGVVARLTLDLVPSFQVRQSIYDALPLPRLLTDFDAIMGGAYSVSLFTDWRGDRVKQVWVKRRVGDAGDEGASDYFGATLADGPRHPSGRSSAEKCTVQGGIPGPWHERLPHFRADAIPSFGAELQSEYFVPRRHATEAARAVAALGEEMAQILLIAEVRTVAADEFWMSPFNGQGGVGFHFTWHPDWAPVRDFLPRLEAALAPFEARPHWGKLSAIDPAVVASRYPRLADFRALLAEFDPAGKFRNPYLERYIFGS